MNTILFYTTTSPYGKKRFGGAETSMRLLAEKLAENGQDVIFVSTSNKKRLLTHSKVKINQVTVFTIYNSLYPISKWNRPRKWVKKYNNYLHNQHIRRIFKNHSIGLVYTYYELDACLYFTKLKEKIKFKYVVRIAGMHWAEKIKRRSARKGLYQDIFNKADALNFISAGLVQLFDKELQKLGMKVKPKNSFILDIGVDLKTMQTNFKKTYNTNNECFKLLMATRFSKTQKRQDIVVEAMRLIPDEIPIELYLVGDGPKRREIENQINQLQVEHKVKLIPFTPQDELWKLMSSADVLVHACDYEGLSKIIIESMAMGLPVLASDVLPLNKYIKDGENSYLVENRPEAWAEKLIEIYNDKHSLYNVGKEAKSFIQDNYNADKNVFTYIEEFNNLKQINRK